MVFSGARILLCAWVASLATAVSAGEIHKCVDDGGTTYQSAPCATGASEPIRMPTATPARADSPGSSLRSYPGREAARKPGPWTHKALTLGMSDDEVLNMPGWGRPSRITRVRVPREWREEWIYDQGLLAEQRLYFANARLVDIVVMSPEARIVGAAAFPLEE